MKTTWQRQLHYNPFGTMAAVSACILGTLGIVLGDGVSQGMTVSLRDVAGPIGHLWGTMFAAGGALKLYGLYAHRTTIEIPGLWLMTGGYAFYAITVVTGLGMHGLAAGIIASATTIGCLLKVNIIMRRAEGAARRHEHEAGE